MLTTYFFRQTTRTTYYGGPAGPYLDLFTHWLAQRGYRHESGSVHMTQDTCGQQLLPPSPSACIEKATKADAPPPRQRAGRTHGHQQVRAPRQGALLDCEPWPVSEFDQLQRRRRA
jgi:hypothetical protein